MASVTKSRRPQQASRFTITFGIGEDRYFVLPLAVHPEVASKAFRFKKQTGGKEVYDVRLAAHGPECDCRGFLRWGHCKHVKTLKAAGMLGKSGGGAGTGAGPLSPPAREGGLSCRG